MALPSTIFKATIDLSDIDRAVYEPLSATVAKHPSETEERLVSRLLAYAIFYEDGLTFTRGLCATDEPDIWVKGGDGRVRLWVEVGLPDAERIIKASRHSERVALFPCGRALTGWESQQLPKLSGIPNLDTVTIDQTFIASLVKRLKRNISWSVTINEGICYLTSENATLETALRRRD